MITIEKECGCLLTDLNKEQKEDIKKQLTMSNPEYENAKRYAKFTSSKIPSHLEFYQEWDNGELWVPRGYYSKITEYLKSNNLKFKTIESTVKFKPFDFKFVGVPRDYQEIAVTEVLNGPDESMLVAGTGAGKTFMAINIISERKAPTLIIVHSKELLYQWQGSLKKFLNYDCGLIGDGEYKVKRITVGIINSVRNKTNELKNKFSQIVLDECFVAGTLVDGKPIENIKIGDYVNSFNHKTNKIEMKRVLHTFKHKTNSLCKINIKNKKQIICTENHPFFTGKEYLTASKLNSSMSVVSIDVLEFSKGDENAKNHYAKLSNLRKTCKMSGKQTLENVLSRSKSKQCEMFKRVCSKGNRNSTQKVSKISKRIQQKIRITTNDRQQPNIHERSKRKNRNNKENKWHTSCMERKKGRKWASNSTTRKTSNCIRLGSRSCSKNSRSHTNGEKKRVVQTKTCTNNVQTRFRKQESKNRNRSRWERTQPIKKIHTRQKENVTVKMERVESVEVYKCGSGSKFEKMCSDGFVYNIEVEDNNNYFVEGVLVHNCHRAPSNMWTTTIQEFNPVYICGFTATPYRRDGLGAALPMNVGEIIHTVSKDELHEIGAVLKPKVHYIFSDFYFRYRDNYAKMIKALVEDTDRNNLIVSEIIKDLKKYNENILALSDRKNHCYEIQRILKSKGIDSEVLTGSLKSSDRTILVDKLRKGLIKVLIATVSLVGEGFDVPDLTALFYMTPIKSRGRLVQSAGRVLRPKKNKSPRIYDIQDSACGILRSQANHRDKIYKDEWGNNEI